MSGPEIIFVSGIKSSTNLANGPIEVSKSPGPASKEIACPVLGTLPNVCLSPEIPQ